MNRVWMAAGLAAGLAGEAELRAEESAGTVPEPLPGRGVTNLTITAAKGDRFLRVGGRWLARAEGPIEPGLALTLNGVRLEGDRLRGPAEITTPQLEKAYGSVHPRFHAASESFVFRKDADDIPNNGPWTNLWRPARYKTNHAQPWIQLDVKGVLKPGDNLLVVSNANASRFGFSVLLAARAEEPQPDPLLPMPCWIVFSESASERVLYEKALKEGVFEGAEKAELLAALGIHDFFRGERKAAVRLWAGALEAAPEFPSRPEILYRVAAERVQAGAWLLPEPAFRRALGPRPGTDAWTELAHVLLARAEGRGVWGGRPSLVLNPVRGVFSVDGRLEEGAWKSAEVFPLRHVLGREEQREGWGEVRFLIASNGLMAGFTGPVPEGAEWVAGTNRDAEVWKDNAVELLVTPDLQFSTYYEFNASPAGGMFDGRHAWCWKTDPAWNGEWESAGRVESNRLTVEYCIPWPTLGLAGPPVSNRWLVATAVRVVKEKGEKGEPVYTYLSATPHRFFDTHRLMDGIPIQLAAPRVRPADVRGVTMTELLDRVPPLAHSPTGRWPMVTWIPFLENPTNDAFQRGESLSRESLRELAKRGLTQAIRFEAKHIPLALALQEAGCRVIIVQGAGVSAEGPESRHRLDEGFIPAGRRVHPCPLLLEGWHAHAMKLREEYKRFREAGVVLDGVWMDDESQPWGGRGEWEQSRHCSRCRTLFPAGVLADFGRYRAFIGQFKQDLYATYIAAPAREAYPGCTVVNWGVVYSTPEEPTPSYWGNTLLSPRTPGLFNALNPVAYGNDIVYRDYWKTAWSNPAAVPLDEAHMDRLYTAVMLGQFSRNASLAERWAPDKACFPWVARYCPDMEDPAIPVLSRTRYREILRHLWLRGADSMQIFNPPRPERPLVHIEEIADAVAVCDELLEYREFLETGTILNTSLPGAEEEGAIWSGLRAGDRAVIRAFTQGSVPVSFTVQPWTNGVPVELVAPPEGATWLIGADGSKTRAKPAPALREWR